LETQELKDISNEELMIFNHVFEQIIQNSKDHTANYFFTITNGVHSFAPSAFNFNFFIVSPFIGMVLMTKNF